MRLLKADRECEARACEPEIKATKRLRSRHLFFLYLLANMRLLKADRECEARACEPEIKANEAAAKQTFVFLVLISEQASAESRQRVRSTCM